MLASRNIFVLKNLVITSKNLLIFSSVPKYGSAFALFSNLLLETCFPTFESCLITISPSHLWSISDICGRTNKAITNLYR